jgi:tetratricopeptide (TPR) repeat protein
LRDTAIANSMSTQQPPHVSTIAPGNIGIIIADFKNESKNVNYDAAGSIEEALRRYFNQNNLNIEIVRISDEIKRGDKQRAQEIGEQYKATLIIWGYYDDGGMYPRILIIEDERVDYPPVLLEDKLVNLAKPPDDFTFYVNRELPNQMSYFALFTVAQLFEFNGRQDEVLALYDQVVSLGDSIESKQVKQNNANVFLAKARLYRYYYQNVELQRQNLQQAKIILEQILSDDTEAYSALNSLGNIYSDFEDYELAISYYKKAISVDPTNSTAHYNLALTLSDLGRVEEARKEYEETIHNDPSYTPAYNNLAIILFNTGDKEKAIKTLSDVLVIDSNFVVARRNRSIFYMETEQPSLALSDLEILVSTVPDDPMFLLNKGVVLKRLGRQDEALIVYNELINIHPKFSSGYNNRGSIFVDQKKFDLGESDFIMAINLEPDDPTGYYNLGNLYVSQENYKAAIEQFTYAIDRDEKFYQAYANRGFAYRQLENYPAAMDDYNKTLGLFDDPFAYSNRGTLKAIMGDNQGAIDDFSMAISLDSDPDYYFNRALAYRDNKRPELAIKDLERGLSLKPRDPQAFRDELAHIKHDTYGTPYPEDILKIVVLISGLIVAVIVYYTILRTKLFPKAKNIRKK